MGIFIYHKSLVNYFSSMIPNRASIQFLNRFFCPLEFGIPLISSQTNRSFGSSFSCILRTWLSHCRWIFSIETSIEICGLNARFFVGPFWTSGVLIISILRWDPVREALLSLCVSERLKSVYITRPEADNLVW